MILKCFGCGVEKDNDILEKYPWPEDELICDEPIQPLFTCEVQPNDREDKLWKIAVYCHSCFHKIKHDMWMSEGEWDSINPIIPFDKLPLPQNFSGGYYKPEDYHPFIEESKSRGICGSCKKVVPTTFRLASYKYDKLVIPNILQGFCDECGKAITIPHISTPNIKEYLDKNNY